MQHSAASDLSLHCLPVSLSWDARLKWVNQGVWPQQKLRSVYECMQSNQCLFCAFADSLVTDELRGFDTLPREQTLKFIFSHF